MIEERADSRNKSGALERVASALCSSRIKTSGRGGSQSMPVTVYPFSSLHPRCTEQGGKWEREKSLLLRMLGWGRNKAGLQHQ